MNNTNIERILIREQKEFLSETAKQFQCNIALTIQPNSEFNNINGLQKRMGTLEDAFNKHFFRGTGCKSKIRYIATIERNKGNEGYHLHLALSVPITIKDWFLRKIESIITHQRNFPRSSVEVKLIDDLDGWISYISKDLYLSECSKNYFFDNMYNNFKKI